MFSRCLKVDVLKFKTTLKQCTSHYNRAFEILFKNNQPLVCLNILIKTIALDELQLDSSVLDLLIISNNLNFFYYLGATNAQSKMKFVMSIVETLGKCIEILKMLLSESNDSDISKEKYQLDYYDITEQNSDDKLDSKKKKQNIVLTQLEEQLQRILKCLIKLASAKVSK